jgi:hypothetical protein
MTLQQFEDNLKRVNPRLRLRSRGYGDIIGLYDGDKYLIRMSKGEFNLNGYRKKYIHDNLSVSFGTIQKRGRKTVVRMLQRMGYIKNLKDYSLLLWGV